MQVFRGVPQRAITPTVLTIGNFDGVHRGHRALLRLLLSKAQALNLPATVLTFEPHPRELFFPGEAPARLSSLREKMTLLAECGVDRLHVVPFNRTLANLSADEFIQKILINGLAVRHLLIGDDFRFGRQRAGDFSLLQQAGAVAGFSVAAMDTQDHQKERISSSAIRGALSQGDLIHAEALLGRSYAISGRVIHGDKIGRQLGFPTANIQLKRLRPPLTGIYAVAVEGLGPQPIRGAASLGVRPTVTQQNKASLEVHLLDWCGGDIYGAHVRVVFLKKLRDEAKYPSLEALVAQIARDVDDTRAFFDAHPL
jgi:riboflavin kinase/FMN adenylyltransferase